MKNFILLAALLSTSAFALYDEDNRLDLYEVQDAKLKEASQAVAYQIYFDELKGWTFNRYWQILTKTGQEIGLCKDERFSDQPTMRNDCAGVLVGEKELLIPGNCITEHYCNNDLFYFMFNYAMKDSTPVALKRDRNDFYKCEKILKRVWDTQSATSYALIELNKKVEGIRPLKISKTNHIAENGELVAVGFPHGMPMKIAGNAFVTDQTEAHFLVSSDIAGTSKGTALINAKTYELEGMLITGTRHYQDTPEACARPTKYTQSEAQELALKVEPLFN